MKSLLFVFIATIAVLPLTDAKSQSSGVKEALLDVSADVVASGFKIPWAIEVIAEDEYLFTDRTGEIYHFRDGQAIALEGVPKTTTFTFAGLVLGGFMDVSLHPRFDTNGLVYLAHVDEAARMVVGRFNFADRAFDDFEVIFESSMFSVGSRIAWPDDEHFFVTLGMGGTPYPDPGPQDLSHHGGKIHRLNADGSVPADNPVFEGATTPSSIWSYGHRDPQGLYFDAEEGVLYETEHGPLGGDELNVVTKGGNYGWPLFSYGLNYDGTPVSDLTAEEAGQTSILPLKGWDASFNMAPSGLERIAGDLFPELAGSFAQRRLIAYDVASGETTILLDQVGRVRDVVELPSGALLILIDTGSPTPSDSGRIVKLTPR